MASKEVDGHGPDKYARNKSINMKLSFEIVEEEKILLATFKQRSYDFWRHSLDLVKFADFALKAL